MSDLREVQMNADRYIYSQTSGRLTLDGYYISTGYSGLGPDKNNPLSQHLPRRGPIPQGLWLIGEAYDSPDHGPFVIPLTPAPATRTFNRSGFLIHGDSVSHPGTASLGCIIQGLKVRHSIEDGPIKLLEVVP